MMGAILAAAVTAGFSGWGPVSIGMPRADAEAALKAAKIAFETKTLHKTGDQLLVFTREDGWKGDVYFEDNKIVNQVGFTSPKLSEKDAKAWIAGVEKALGAPSPVGTYEKPEERRGQKVFPSKGASLGVSWSIDKEGRWTLFETYHQAGWP